MSAGGDLDGVVEALEGLDSSDEVDLGPEGLRVYRAEADSGEVFRAAKGRSTDFESAARGFRKLEPRHISMLLVDLEDETDNADFAVFLPDDVADEFSYDRDRAYGPGMLYVENDRVEDDLVVRTWPQTRFRDRLLEERFEELYVHIKNKVFNEGQMLAVPSLGTEYSDWGGRKSVLLSDTHTVMASPDIGTEHGIEEGVSSENIRERKIRDGEMIQGDVYAENYEKVDLKEMENGVEVIADGDVLKTYDGYSVKEGGEVVGEQLPFLLTRDQQ